MDVLNTATAHSLYSRQRNFENKAQDVLSKPASDVTKDDARELQSTEARPFFPHWLVIYLFPSYQLMSFMLGYYIGSRTRNPAR